MNHAAFIAWAAGRNDAMGKPFADWLVARVGPDGRALRDAHDHVVYETQAEWLARHGSQAVTPARPVQQELFA